jgi:hypothetical protein
MGDMVPRQEEGLVPIGRLRQELAEATTARSIPRLQRVIGAATVAAEAQRRVAKLAAGSGHPAEIVEAAREGASAAATVRLEAEAEVGRILRTMAENDERQRRGHPQSDKPKMAELMGESLREGEDEQNRRSRANVRALQWQKVGDIPDDIRAAYIEEVKAKGSDPTTAGLLRYAAIPKEEPRERDNLEVAYDDVVRALSIVLRYDPGIMFGHASNTRRRTKFRELMDKTEAWIERAKRGFGEDE